ncbi:MAG: hypothetical protein IJ188_07365 [Clostridia bacterium]|nr:hypothetical protein [Clostridia bacterium]
MENAQPLKKIKYKQRPGFETKPMRWVYRILYPYFHCKVNLPEELQNSQEPVVFVANHYNVFGPVSFVLSMPVVSNIWMNEDIVQTETSAKAFLPGIKRLLPFLGEKQAEWICGKLAALAVRVLNRFGMIPVNRHQPSKLISTMRQSIAALEQGHNLLIFPETGEPEYSLTSVTPFFSGFAMLGRLYHRKTGKLLRFCPCYIDEQHHQIRLGEMVTYDPEADSHQETERVSDELNLRIRQMAAETRGVQKEKTSPGRQTVLFFCNLVRLLLLIPLITMLGLDNPRMILLFYGLSEGIRILFNAVCSTYNSSNRLSFLLSHGLGLLTDGAMMIYLAARLPRLRWVLYALIMNGLVILFSNIHAFWRQHRCAGVNYFDTLSANLLFVICLQQLLNIRLSRWVLGAINLAAIIFLACSAGFAVAFNSRLGEE